MNKTTITFLLALFLSANSSMAEESPSEVVQKFCQLDYEGARLSSETNLAIRPLIAYPNEPGWDIAVGIKSYEIRKEMIDGNVAAVSVEYDIDQIWPEGILPHRQEIVKLIKQDDVWKIQGYIIYPRVSAKVLCSEYSMCSDWANNSQERTE